MYLDCAVLLPVFCYCTLRQIMYLDCAVLLPGLFRFAINSVFRHYLYLDCAVLLHEFGAIVP